MNVQISRLSRRALLVGATSAGASGLQSAPRLSSSRLKINVFSKHFHWTDCKEMAQMSAELGFDGVDLTVRPDGHVLPERVKDDLPTAVEAIRKVGLDVPMITTMIADTSSPHAEAILRTARSLGIRYYRWGYLRYVAGATMQEQISKMKTRVKALSELNRDCQICGMYHTHSGVGRVGASIWDLWLLFNECDPQWIGVNYDVGHAVVEGGLGGWIHSARLVPPFLRGVALKDFKWGQDGSGNWQPHWCAPGEGMVNFALFFKMLKEIHFSGPLQLHYEYPGLGGAEDGLKTLGIEKRRFLSILTRDLEFTKQQLRDAALS